MTEMILLGAGASVDAGLLTSAQMVPSILDECQKRGVSNLSWKRTADILATVVDRLNGHLRIAPDIEDVLIAIDSFQHRSTESTTPFVESWHAELIQLDQSISTPHGPQGGFEIASDFIRGLVTDRVCFKAQPSQFGSNPAPKLEYLLPVLNLLKSQDRLTIATLNYDPCIEVMCFCSGIGCETGIEAWNKHRTFTSSMRNGIYLLKLHGSILWAAQTSSSAVVPSMSARNLDYWQVSMDPFFENVKPQAILGMRNKLTEKGPFLDLLQSFKTELQLTDKLTVVGYSFCDSHINRFIGEWLTERSGSVLQIVDPSFSNTEEFAKSLNDLHQSEPARIQIFNETAAVGLKHLFGDYTIPPTTLTNLVWGKMELAP